MPFPDPSPQHTHRATCRKQHKDTCYLTCLYQATPHTLVDLLPGYTCRALQTLSTSRQAQIPPTFHLPTQAFYGTSVPVFWRSYWISFGSRPAHTLLNHAQPLPGTKCCPQQEKKSLCRQLKWRKKSPGLNSRTHNTHRRHFVKGQALGKRRPCTAGHYRTSSS